MALVIRRLLRAVAIAAFFFGGAALAAAAVTHQMLDGTTWTNPTPAPSVRPTPAPTAAPAPGRTASVGPNDLIGRCALATQAGAVVSPCTAPGARKIVGTVRRDAAHAHPCRTTPFTDTVRPHGAYWLCLGTP
ncbi:hypothetical protein [Streptomyces sp. NPDC047070]|uniref:hypothetical protein n=1 Tax=Streptomyces sp. NPDC047070 TaxID=3154923 RepID=UPI0034545DC5